MKNLKQELIDFIDHLTFGELESAKYGHTELIVDKYLKSINSNESNEFRTVGNNEQDVSVCPVCKGDGYLDTSGYGDYDDCLKCNGTGQI
jgi:DnaJ-class molecular chaperone